MRNLSRAAAILFFFGWWVDCSLSFSAQAANPLIVEVQIAREKSSDDFIKIYNPTNSDIYLNNYQGSYFRLVKRTKTGTKDYTIKSWSKDSEAKIPANGFYLWANKDYQSLSNVNTLTSQTVASNNGIALRLGPENTGTIVDAVGWGDFNNILFEGNPFPENPSPNQRLERKQISGVYQDTNDNSQDFYLNPPSEQSLAKIQTPSPEESQPESKLETPNPIIYSSGIIINEILPSPVGPDETEEWSEIFNQNSFEVDLSGWQISDTVGKITTYSFSMGTKILPQGFLVLSRPTTKITLNNDRDGLNLIQPNGKIIDSASYEKAPRGESYNRTDSGWAWSTTLTPGSANIIFFSSTTPQLKTEEKEEPKPEAESLKINESKNKEEVAAVGEQIPKEISFLPFLIALVIAIFSGIIILILKRKTKDFDFLKKLE